jgi:DNA-directed RNA polymerase specialized sigma24 family protein
LDPSKYAELQEVREAWYTLAQADRDIIVARWGDGLEWQQIAERDGVQMRTARMRGVRAVKRLAQRTGTGGVRLSMDKDFTQRKTCGDDAAAPRHLQ